MTIAVSHSGSWSSFTFDHLQARYQHLCNRVRAAQKRRTLYYETIHELSVLSDRDLADIGIYRCDIRRIARDSAPKGQTDETL